MSDIPTLAEAMVRDARDAIQVMFHADTAAMFDKMLADGLSTPTDDAEGLVRLISLAYTANVIADAKECARAKDMHGNMACWYRDESQNLLRKAVDVVAALGAASRVPRDLN